MIEVDLVNGGAVDQLYAALSRGDVAAARGCCTADARFWHSFDQAAIDLNAACDGWQKFIAGFPERRFVDVRRSETPSGVFQQHLMVARLASGALRGWPICIVVQLRDGLIARLDEYMDRAGSYSASDGETTTPGLDLQIVPAS